MNAKSILYTGAFRFPDGDAAAFRVFAVGSLLAQLGHVVDFAGWESGVAEYEYQGHRCIPQSEFRQERKNPVTRLLGFLLRGRRTLAWLRASPRYDIVIAYNPPALFALLLLAYGRRHGVKVVLDSTEWYDSRHLPGGRFGPAALENWCRMQVCYRYFRYAIVISTFLERHLKGSHTVLIPPLLPPSASLATRNDPRDGIRLLYAGEAGRKDSLCRFIAALPALATSGISVELHLAGMTGEQLADLLRAQGIPTALAESVHCHGRVSRARVLELYGHSHFSVLFREDARYAWAGFPTKAVESMASGCPLITNAVGDLASIAVHLDNAIVVAEADASSVLPGLMVRLIADGAYPLMSQRAAHTAERRFGLERHRDAMRHFLEVIAAPPTGGRR